MPDPGTAASALDHVVVVLFETGLSTTCLVISTGLLMARRSRA